MLYNFIKQHMDGNSWILYLRSEYLNDFFIFISFFTTRIFYMSAIAVGFWLRPGGTTFVQLGFLIPASIIINLVLQNCFGISRPPELLHLIKVDSELGFPSTDVQTAVIFWGILCLRWQQTYNKAFAFSMIILVILAQVYLGINSLADVISGCFFGIMILVLWNPRIVSCFIKDRFIYWNAIIFLLFIYFITSEDYAYNLSFAMSLGWLIGFGVSLNAISRWQYEDGMFSGKHIGIVAGSFIMLLIMAEAIPTLPFNMVTRTSSIFLESLLLGFMIFTIFPLMQIFFIKE